MFSSTTYSERRRRLAGQLESGVILLLGNDESPMNYADNPYHFRQDSSFLYFFGIDQPGLAGIIDIDEGTALIFGDELSIDNIVWMGNQPTLEERSRSVGVTRTAPADHLGAALAAATAQGRTVHFLPPYRPENRLKLLELLAIDPSAAATAASVELIQAIVAQRIIKSDEEITEIEKAVCTSVDMHVAAMSMAAPGMVEVELAAEVLRVARAAGGDIAFPIILTSNGQILHNHCHRNTLREGDMVLCDFGAESPSHYAGDLSSTFPVAPTFTARQKEIYALSLAAHESAVAALRPGVPFKEIHLRTCRVIAQGLKEIGLIKGNVDDAVAAGAHAMFFPCGLGHLMGLDVHDMEDLGEVNTGYDGRAKSTEFGLKSLRLARPLEPGFVLTIEPGIYFIPELIDLWQGENRHREFLCYDRLQEYRDFGGIRNEEDYLITEHGYRLLGKPKPKTIEEVEAIRRQG